MIRRSHKKSKQGCVQCKRSHKKCDESRPACFNCTSAKKQCSYAPSASSRSPSDCEFILSIGPEDLTNSRSPHRDITSHTTNSNPQPLPHTPAPPHAEPYVNLFHLELFHNLTSDPASLFGDKSRSKDLWIATVLRYNFTYPYLMYETLSLSAFHLSIKYPSKSELYLTESTTLQEQALSIFNSSTRTVNQDNVIPAFCFSALLGLHFFCDTFLTPSPDLNTFLDRLVQSIQLLRGVRTMIGDSWEFIKNSDIKYILAEGPMVNRNDKVTHAFEDLHTNFSQSHTLSVFESKVYCEAITRLIWVYNTQPSNGTSYGPPDPRIVTAWPITISAEYTELLNQRKPEALVVMAYFSILLHCGRAFWAVGDAGRFLLAAVEEYLGEEWVDCLVVPKGIVPPL